MSIIPSNIGRVPNLLVSQLALGNINRTSLSLLTVQDQLATGIAVSRYSDDAVKAALIATLDDRLDRAAQVRRNLSHATSSLSTLESVLAEAGDLANDAKSIAMEQMNFGSSSAERAGQAAVIDQILTSLFNVARRRGEQGYALGGAASRTPPVEEFLGGYRFRTHGGGLTTDIPLAAGIPITLSARSALGNAGGVVRGATDLDPSLTADTRLVDLNGARGLGVALGRIALSFDNGPLVEVDLTGSDSVRDVLARLEAAIRAEETRGGSAILGPGGVSVEGGAISIDVLPGSPEPALRFFEVGSGTTARDLGLAADDGTGSVQFTATSPSGLDTGPRLTMRSRIDSLEGLGGALGAIRLGSMGRSIVVDLSGAETLEDIRNLIEGAGLGLRVAVNEAGTGIDIINEVAGPRGAGLSIEEVSGNGGTASRLGIRTFAPSTLISAFNDGRGVEIRHGDPDPERNVDFAITLGNTAGTTIDIDLRPEDMVNVGTLLARIESQIADGLVAAGLPSSALVVGLSAIGNGIVFTQDTGFTGPLGFNARNGSPAAEQLGLLTGTWEPSSATFTSEDRAKVRVSNLFTHLIDLRDALRNNDTRGIGLAGEDLDSAIARLAENRGVVGSYARRVEKADVFEQDRAVLDERTRSMLRDTDFVQAATRMSLLQTQLQAAMRTSALGQSITLLDFLG